MILAKTAMPSALRPGSRFPGATMKPFGISPWAQRPRPGLRWRSVVARAGLPDTAGLRAAEANRRLASLRAFSV